MLAGGDLTAWLSGFFWSQRRDCVAEVVGFELRNVVANDPFERSHIFRGIRPNSGPRDYSRLSCSVADAQLEALAANAQKPPLPVIGVLGFGWPETNVAAAFHKGLNEIGYSEGRNVAIEFRWAQNDNARLVDLAADLVRRQVSVIAALGGTSALAAKAATATIPIVFVTGADPLKFGFVASFNRPGGNITGIWVVSTVLAQKRLQLIRELLPKAELIALLVNPSSPVAEPQTRDAQAAAYALGLKLRVLNAVTENDFDQVFATVIQERADALFVSADPFLSSRREHLVALAARHAVPTLYEIREFVEVGGLMSYGTVLREGYYKGGIYAGRVLKGVHTADLPVEQVNKLELVINAGWPHLG
jgi:ABC-type uncharacterized transport system substrate-binding protein